MYRTIPTNGSIPIPAFGVSMSKNLHVEYQQLALRRQRSRRSVSRRVRGRGFGKGFGQGPQRAPQRVPPSLTLGTISAFAWTSGEIWLSNCQEDMFISVGKFIFCIPFFLFPGDIINLTGQSGVYQTRSGHVWNVNCFAVTLRH